MSLTTRAEADAAILVRSQTKRMMARAGLNVTSASPNPDLTGPLMEALAELVYPSASLAAVTDTDIARVPEATQPALIALAEIKTLESVLLELASRPRTQKFFNRYETDQGDPIPALTKLLDAKKAAYIELVSPTSSGAVAASFDPVLDHGLDTTRFFPPFGQ